MSAKAEPSSSGAKSLSYWAKSNFVPFHLGARLAEPAKLFVSIDDVTVAEVTYSNSISVAEHVVMMILALVRNYLPSHQWVVQGGWNIADCVERSYDLEGMTVGSIGSGRIGLASSRK